MPETEQVPPSAFGDVAPTLTDPRFAALAREIPHAVRIVRRVLRADPWPPSDLFSVTKRPTA